MKAFSVEDKVFQTYPYFVFGCTGEELKAHIKRKLGVEIEAPKNSSGTQITTRDKKNWRVRIIWTRGIPNNPQDTAILVHELFHLVVMICADKQVPIKAYIENGECGDEAAAYLIDFFFFEVMKRLNKKSPPKRKKR